MQHKLGVLVVLTSLASQLVSGCATAATREPIATPTPILTATPAELRLTVPRSARPTLDGTLLPAEWSSAARHVLSDGSELLLMHDGEHLYLGIRGLPDSVGSVCVAHGDQAEVLHSSLGLGKAVFKRTEDTWRRTQTFGWTWWAEEIALAAQQQEDFLRSEGWLATVMGTGSPGEMQYQISWPGSPLRLAVTYFTGDGTNERTAWWPEQLQDPCRNRSLIQGRPSARLRFQPEQWAELALG